MSERLCELDVLPVGCALQIEARGRGDQCHAVRFRATRDDGAESSEWSGWFEYEGEPIPLVWAVFWPPDD